MKPGATPFARVPRWCALVALAVACCPANAQLTLHNPQWNITLTTFGYSDLLLDNTPGFEGREYLSGEWAGAVAWEDAAGTAVPPVWLEPEFICPDWSTNSNFRTVSPISQVGSNEAGLPIARSVIANASLRITQTYEMIDTVTGMPLGMRPASAGGSGMAYDSSRYVLKQSYSIRNIASEALHKVQLFQLLHGFISQKALHDSRSYPGTIGEYRHDTVLRGIDYGTAGIASSDIGLEDFIALQSAVAPSAFEVGYYGVEGNGIDNHLFGKPSEGVHLSIEDNWQHEPYLARQGTDLFEPPERWIGGAQRWELGDLQPGDEVGFEVVLAILTGTRVPVGLAAVGSSLGGPNHPGGVRCQFEQVEREGTLFAKYASADETEIAQHVAAGKLPVITFDLPGPLTQFWQLDFDGEFSGGVSLVFAYDPDALPPDCDETKLAIYHFEGGSWEPLTGVINLANDTIHVSSPGFSPFVLGVAPPGGEYLISNDYVHWIASQLPGYPAVDLAPDADPDHDRLMNVLEYALGTEPGVPGTVPLRLQMVEGHAQLAVTRPSNHAGVLLEAEVADSLVGPWTADPARILFLGATSQPGGTETLVFRSALSVEQQPTLFLRLRASLTP